MSRTRQYFRQLFLSVLGAALATASAQAQASSVIASNFGPGNSFNASAGWAIRGSTIQPPDGLSHAMAFTSGADFVFTDLFLPLTVAQGTGSALVALMGDASGRPGAVIESWQLDNLPSLFGSPTTAVLQATSILNPLFTSGTQYWIAVFAVANDSNISWWLNSLGNIGPLAFAFNSASASAQWSVLRNTQSAFEVQGHLAWTVTTPEPGTLLLVGTGLACVWYRRRTKWRD